MSYLASMFVKYFYDPSVLRRLLKFDFPFGKRVVILGGNYAGCELAETLMNRGKKVTIIEESGRIGSDIGMIHKWVFLKNLKNGGVEMITSAQVVEVNEGGVRISVAGQSAFMEADTVVKVGVTTNTKLGQELEKKGLAVYPVGDCSQQGMLMEAVASGFLAGQKI